MPNQAIAEVVKISASRMLGDGLHWPDIREIVARADQWDSWREWYEAFAEIGDRYEGLAEKSLRAGHRISAGELFWRASMHYHYAQFNAFDSPELREAGQKRKTALYQRAASNFRPAAERIQIPFEGFIIPGYLRLPLAAERPPCVLLIGGLESTKEESFLFENMCLSRGLATFTFDGPGQGEMYFQCKMRPHFERFTSAVIDYLKTRPEIDVGRLGVIGRSLGGHYAAKSAAYDDRINCCVCWGALYELQSCWANMQPVTRQGFRYCSGQPTLEAAREYLQVINLEGYPERIRCALYVQHGAKDRLIPASQAQRLVREACKAPRLVLDLQPEGDHCCHNLYHVTRHPMADFLAETLYASAPPQIAGNAGARRQ